MAEIIIDGIAYELPESFTLAEMRIVERYCGGHLNESGYEFAKLLASIHVAVARKRPDEPFEQIEKHLGELPMDVLDGLAGQSPPAVAEEQQGLSVNGDSSSESSGHGSEAVPENESRASSGSQVSAIGSGSSHSTSAD